MLELNVKWHIHIPNMNCNTGFQPWSPTNHWLKYLRIVCHGHPRKWSVHLPMHWTQGEVGIKSKDFEYSPWKMNMEPTNYPFRKENDLPNLHDYVPCFSSGVYMWGILEWYCIGHRHVPAAYQQRCVWSHRMLAFLIKTTFGCIGSGNKNVLVQNLHLGESVCVATVMRSRFGHEFVSAAWCPYFESSKCDPWYPYTYSS